MKLEDYRRNDGVDVATAVLVVVLLGGIVTLLFCNFVLLLADLVDAL